MWTILDVPFGGGGSRPGCHLAPEALRAAGLVAAIQRRGDPVVERGAVVRGPLAAVSHPNPAVHGLAEMAAWTKASTAAAYAASGEGKVLFLGGDHSVSAGTIAGVARRAAERDRPLFVLWIDAHPDFHTLDSTRTGNLHGVPLAYVSGLPGFTPYLPPVAAPVDPRRICMLGTRDVDAGEAGALAASGAGVHDMAAVATRGAVPLLDAFLARVAAAGGWLHVSFDVDALDPRAAPAVGTAVPGGLSLEAAHALMRRLRASGQVDSLDIVELNPTLDADGGTARTVVDLVASLMGRRTDARKRA